jgi:hypothetical protein
MASAYPIAYRPSAVRAGADVEHGNVLGPDFRHRPDRFPGCRLGLGGLRHNPINVSVSGKLKAKLFCRGGLRMDSKAALLSPAGCSGSK